MQRTSVGGNERRACNAWAPPEAFRSAATGGGCSDDGFFAVSVHSGRRLRFLRPQGPHHRWSEEDSHLWFHSLPPQHSGGEESTLAWNGVPLWYSNLFCCIKFLFLFVACFQMWPDLIQKAKDGGLDVIQTYVFWNGHEPSPGQVCWLFHLKISLYHFHNFLVIFKKVCCVISLVLALAVLFWREL